MMLDIATVVALINKRVANISTTGLESVKQGEDGKSLVFVFSDGTESTVEIPGLLTEEQKTSIDDIKDKADIKNIGDLNSLETENKSDIVNAINSVNSKIPNLEKEIEELKARVLITGKQQ